MDSLQKAILTRADELLVDLVGFGDRERFADLPTEANPFSLFPAANSAILIGRRVTRGTLRGIEEGTNLGDYENFGLHWLSDEFLSQCTYDLVQMLETAGWEAMPIIPGATANCSLKSSDPKVWPDFTFAAVACGLGEIALGGFILNNIYGPRQRFHLILTDARLESSPMQMAPVCDQCGECAVVCPFQAIDVSRASQISINGKKMTVAACDPALCRECSNGVRGPVDASGMPDRIAMLCCRTCIEHLNQKNLIENRFRNAFRSRQAWVKSSTEGE